MIALFSSALRRFAVAVLLLGLAGWHGAVNAQEPSQEADTDKAAASLNVFEVAALQRGQLAAVQHFRAGRYRSAEATLRGLTSTYPRAPVPHYLLGSILSVMGKPAEALESLEIALANGFRGIDVLERDPNLAALREMPRYTALLDEVRARAASPVPANTNVAIKPAAVENGVAAVDTGNTVWDARFGVLRSVFGFDDDKPVSDIVHGGEGEVAQLLNELYASGAAAGNHGDLYDNRDDDHSNLARDRLPQLTYVEYASAAREARIHRGLNSNLFYNAITFGNSSTAVVGNQLWRSQARLALTDGDTPAKLFRQYSGNHLYLYPEHRDHDPRHGDVFPANTPYLLVSQGSSGSDQPFLLAVGATLAAFQPEVKSFLRQSRLVMPTVQMILRRTQKSVASNQDYLSGAAHPSVFRASDLDVPAMIRLANSLAIDDVPPIAVLRVIEESRPVPGVEIFGNQSERLFDTPAAIARIVRSTAYEKRIVVRAAVSHAFDTEPPKFHWAVLRGDATRIRILPRTPDNSEVEIIVPWHERRTVPGRRDLTTDRVDIAVFVDNGAHISAPSFVSLLYPPLQKRTYDAANRILRVDYRDPSRAKRYADPILFLDRNWTDTYTYDSKGELTGWRRTAFDRENRFTRHGARVVETDEFGRPARAQKVVYLPAPTRRGRQAIAEIAIDEFLTYSYAGDDDHHGALVE